MLKIIKRKETKLLTNIEMVSLGEDKVLYLYLYQFRLR